MKGLLFVDFKIYKCILTVEDTGFRAILRSNDKNHYNQDNRDMITKQEPVQPKLWSRFHGLLSFERLLAASFAGFPVFFISNSPSGS